MELLMRGDLAQLTQEQRSEYYKKVCDTLGLNILTQPFGYIEFEGRLQLYAKKDATEQLRKIHAVSITERTTTEKDSVFATTVKAVDKTGRTDIATGAVALTYTTQTGAVKNMTGVGLANAIMKSETKAKRRVTLSICGLGMLDESELEEMITPPPQRDSDVIIQRNIGIATVNATSGGSGGIHAGTAELPLEDTVVHIGKAEGNMLGRKVGELPDAIIDWLYLKWRDKLGPSATDQDFRLKQAVEAEYSKRKAGPVAAPESPQALPEGQDSTPRHVKLDRLLEHIEDMAMTPAQFMGYCQLAGMETTEKDVNKLTDSQLDFLLRDWSETKAALEEFVKPKVVDEKPKRKKKERGKEL